MTAYIHAFGGNVRALISQPPINTHGRELNFNQTFWYMFEPTPSSFPYSLKNIT